ncbi:MAG: alpha/beta hydrolase [Elusimicrobiota bacterium]|jgi:pimeloyl-ACP methyl ester carboxylesterase
MKPHKGSSFIAHRVKVPNIIPRDGPNWLLIPGGPGMGPEYLSDLFGRLDLKGSIWTFDVVNTDHKSLPDEEVVDGWKRSLLEAARRLKPVLIFGHSFGGMLALSTKGLEKHIAALILADSDPVDWLKDCAESPIPRSELAAWGKKFDDAPSDSLYKDYFSAIAPYYFSKKYLRAGRALIAQNSYSCRTFMIGNEHFFSNYEIAIDLRPIPVFCLAGEHDIITPIEIYQRSTQFKEKTDVRYFSIPSGGHFPWVENLQDVSTVLQRIEKAVFSARAGNRATRRRG